jgi:restriction system protein
MTVPDFQAWFLPLLRRVGDGEVHEMRKLYEQLADELGLTDEDRAELLPSGTEFRYRNRISWARTYLKKAGLVESPGRGKVQITDLGRSVLASPPEKLSVPFLRKFPAFVEFYTTQPESPSPVDPHDTGGGEETPEETLERVHSGLSNQLVGELLDHIKAAPAEFFERLVVDLLLRMGYGGSREDAGRTVGKSGDGGIDGIINEDPLGLDTVCLQAKRWENTVGRPVVQAFAGSLEGFRAKKGVLITTSTFSQEALHYAQQIEKRMILIDGPRLARLMVQYNLGVNTVATYELKRIDTDYFEEE